MDLVVALYETTRAFPKMEQYVLADPMRGVQFRYPVTSFTLWNTWKGSISQGGPCGIPRLAVSITRVRPLGCYELRVHS